ncbi:MAG: hypothetical protein K2L03_01105 [Bacteroidales bacterium]|nr:hypothetical protein [Bacteroidales bacterium]MDE7103392.1 hypothetical protein [Bacteroidales bacterium]
MATWWDSLDLLMKVLWGITLSASLIFVIQSIMTFVGLGGEGGFDGDFSTDFDDLSTLEADPGMNLYTFRNLVNFLLGFGWTAILLRDRIASVAWLMVLAVLVGIALVAVVMYLFKWLNGMQQSGNIDVFRSAVGCQGRVYLTIPAERKGEGKVQITINGSVREYNAVTDGDAIKTGTPIQVVEVLNSNTLAVEELNSLIV